RCQVISPNSRSYRIRLGGIALGKGSISIAFKDINDLFSGAVEDEVIEFAATVEVEGKPCNDLMSRKVKFPNAVTTVAIGKGFIPITLDDVEGFLVRTILFRVIENEMAEFATAVEIEGKPYSTRIHDATVFNSIALEVEIDRRLNDSRVGCGA